MYGAGAVDIEREMNTAAGVYGTWDRFGRTLQQKWFRSTTSRVDVKHGYDYASNRLWREDVVAAANSQDHDEFYTYDGLQRLKLFDRGNLTGTPPTAITGTPAKEQDWELDQLGNWANLLDKTSGTTTLDQDRAHNSVNEIDDDNAHADGPAGITTTTGTNWADPEYDAAGNMTTMPQIGDPATAHDAVYDAWNRLVEYDAGLGVPKYEYNGLNQLIVRSTILPTYYYYNDKWQVIVEDNSFVSTNDALLAWHPYYIDALAVRFRENDRHAFLHDANFNVTAAYDINSSSGTYRQVVERYQYSPYGEVTFLDANFAVDSDQVSDILNNYLYTGRERDLSSKLQLNRNRWYHAGLGRWLTQDPIGYEADELNLYGFVSSNPVIHVDPRGLKSAVIVRPTVCLGSRVGVAAGCAAADGPLIIGEIIGAVIIVKALHDTCKEKPTCATEFPGMKICPEGLFRNRREACIGCNGPSWKFHGTELVVEGTDGLDFPVFHHNCKPFDGGDAGVGVICGRCCVEGPPKPREDVRCKCAPNKDVWGDDDTWDDWREPRREL